MPTGIVLLFIFTIFVFYLFCFSVPPVMLRIYRALLRFNPNLVLGFNRDCYFILS